MASFDMVVPTDPMADSIDGVSGRVDAATVAVVGMQAAVIQAETEAADSICANVNRGFYTLVASQISQKKVKAQTAAEAQLISLRQFAQSLLRIRGQMARDFERIASRYARVFRILDDALRSRIHQLDAAAVMLSAACYKAIERGTLGSGGAPILVSHQEGLESRVRLEAGSIKAHCNNMISEMREMVVRGNRLRRATASVLQPAVVFEPTPVMLPVLVMEADDLYITGNTTRAYFVGGQTSSKMTEQITRAIHKSGGAFLWGDQDPAKAKCIVDCCIRKYVTRKAGSRAAAIMAELIAESKWQELQGEPQ